MDWVFIPIVVGALVIGLILGHLAAEQRRKMWAALAEKHGFRHYEGDPLALRQVHSGFSLFQIGHSKKVLHTLEGLKDGQRWIVFDYRYTTGSGKHQQTHQRTGVLVDLPFRASRLKIRPEHFGDTIAAALGFDDIDMESDAFNRKYHVSAEVKRFAYEICNPRMMEYLIAAEGHCWEMQGNSLLFHSNRLRDFDEYEFEHALILVNGFMKHLPEHLSAGRV